MAKNDQLPTESVEGLAEDAAPSGQPAQPQEQAQPAPTMTIQTREGGQYFVDPE